MSREYPFFVYMVSNRAGAVLYTGVTNELPRRVWEHQTGAGSKFTQRYQVDRLVYFEHYDEATEAIAREKQSKGWTRAKRKALIRTVNPSRKDPGDQIDACWQRASEGKLVKQLDYGSTPQFSAKVEGPSARYTRSGCQS